MMSGKLRRKINFLHYSCAKLLPFAYGKGKSTIIVDEKFTENHTVFAESAHEPVRGSAFSNGYHGKVGTEENSPLAALRHCSKSLCPGLMNES